MAGEALDRALAALPTNPPPTTEVVLAAVCRAYNEDRRAAINPATLDASDRSRIRSWLTDLLTREDSSAAASLLVARSKLDHLPLFGSMGEKISWLAQHGCPVCVSIPGIHVFPVEVSPWSHQANPAASAALRCAVVEAIANNPAYANAFQPFSAGVGVCIRLVFTLADRVTIKDCDNMAKGFIDAFEGVLYQDDRQIDHLSIIRLSETGTRAGYVLVRCAPSTINEHDDVIDRTHSKIAFMTATELRVSDFMRPAGSFVQDEL